MLVIITHPLRCDFQRLTLLGAKPLQCLLKAFRIQLQLSHAADLKPIKAVAVFNQCGITLNPDPGQNLIDGPIDRQIRDRLPSQQLL